MAKVANLVKLQIPAGKANPAPPIGPALGSAGAVMLFYGIQRSYPGTSCRSNDHSTVITVYSDRSFKLKQSSPAPILLKAAGIKSGEPNKEKVGAATSSQVEEIAKTKMPDLNCSSFGSCTRSKNCSFYGVVIEG